jgi:Phage capsid family
MMCAQRNAWDDDPEGDAAPDERPFGTRPFGTRPFGTRPFGTRPFGTRPFGTRPFGTRPFGTRPFGTRPFGTRPFGTRPFGTRPFGTRDDEPGEGGLDPGVWSADIAELFCSMSATVRLGARIVYDVENLLIPNRRVEAVYLARPDRIDSPAELLEAERSDEPEPAQAGRSAAAALARSRVSAGQRLLRPSEHELSVQIVVRNSLLRAVERHPDVADALKQDIARALVFEADGAFLHGRDGQAEPAGITAFCREIDYGSADDALELARAILTMFRVEEPKRFDTPGWVLAPATLDELTRQLTADQVPPNEKSMRTLDATRLLQLDGLDGGTLLGYPFVVSRAAADEDGNSRIYFSSDWTEAWIAAGSDLVCVDFSTQADFAADSTVVKAVMNHDFVVRRPGLFTFTAERSPA